MVVELKVFVIQVCNEYSGFSSNRINLSPFIGDGAITEVHSFQK